MRISSYNILAPTYARPDRYPFTDSRLLAWGARRDRLAARISGLDADVICLQEVEPYVYRFLQDRLDANGYRAVYAQKSQNRPDGSATFYREDRLTLNEERLYRFHDGTGSADSGHLALTAHFEFEGLAVTVVNTHIRWDRPESRGREHVGYRQVIELLEWCPNEAPCWWVVCGDFNAEPDSDLVAEVLSHRFTDAYGAAPQPTANSERRAKRIDYLFHSEAFVSKPTPLPEIADVTPLPSEIEPSDHLPISADLTAVSVGGNRANMA